MKNCCDTHTWTFLFVTAAKERCGEELLPWAEVLSLKDDCLVPDLGQIMAMEEEEEGWRWQGILAAIFGFWWKAKVLFTKQPKGGLPLVWKEYIYRRWTWQNGSWTDYYSHILQQSYAGKGQMCQSYSCWRLGLVHTITPTTIIVDVYSYVYVLLLAC